ncbi:MULTISPECIES: hypothetical protein [Rhizobium/Agrobacterium group]|uniref:hypothetical protein n=1 Tax=Rhizobium/Agrobacterium group TaxID=227290 RepID=UPI001485BFE6|nr:MULTISPECIES: hypothetical protein [Rhizobium/Agrobacterium group]NSX88673.1 hypothetical protein [Agrobacterium tumefaciens]
MFSRFEEKRKNSSRKAGRFRVQTRFPGAAERRAGGNMTTRGKRLRFSALVIDKKGFIQKSRE